MSVKASPDDEQEARELLQLFHAIVARDEAAALRLLAASPHLARRALQIGATRADAKTHYFEAIHHYVYAGDTPLHVAAAAYEFAIAEQLAAKGAHAGAKNRRGAEPLHYAADGIPGSNTWNPDRQHAVIEVLIRAGANPNAQDKSGVAPLHRAVRTRSTAAVRALLARGADPRAKNKSGSTPLHLAVQNTGRGSSGSAESRAEQEQIIRLLREHGARGSDLDASGKSVLDCAPAGWIHALLE